MVLAALTIISNTIYVFFSSLVFILLAVVIANVGSGGSAGGGKGGGPFNPVEEALLAGKCRAENRNRVFAFNSFVGSIMGSLGALASGLPQYLQERWRWGQVTSYKPLFLLTIVFSIALLAFAIGSAIFHWHVSGTLFGSLAAVATATFSGVRAMTSPSTPQRNPWWQRWRPKNRRRSLR